MLILLMSVHLILFCRYCYGSNVCLPRIPHTPCFCNVFAGILISKVMVLEGEAVGRSLSAEGWRFHNGISALIKKTLRTSPEVQWLRGLPSGASGKELTCQCRRLGFDPWVGKIPWRRAWRSTSVVLPGESQGRRNLAGYTVHRVTKSWT